METIVLSPPKLVLKRASASRIGTFSETPAIRWCPRRGFGLSLPMTPQESPSTASIRISAFVVCCNEERNIRRCLDSLHWCDEIVVVDSGSTDRTLSIAREFTDRIFHRDWSGFVAQKRYGLQQCRGTWVLNIDADEEVSSELRAQIESILAASSDQCAGYEVLRVVFHMGKWWRKGGWYPEYRLRLCRRDRTTWGGRDPHEHAEVSGATQRLSGELRHYTYRDLQDQVRALNSHSSAAAKSLWESGARSSLLWLVARPVARFIKFYISRRGFREGASGFIVAVLEAGYVFLKYAKLWELEKAASRQK